MAMPKMQMVMIEKKLDELEVEVIRMEVMPIPTEKLDKKEIAELRKIDWEMRNGRKSSARKLFKELG